MNRRKVPTQPTTKTIPHTEAYQKDHRYHQLTYQKKHTLTNEFLCVTSLAQRCRRRRSSARPLGPDHSVTTFHGKLLLAGPLGHRGALALVVATRPQATRLRNSRRLLLAGPLCPGPLGPAAVTVIRLFQPWGFQSGFEWVSSHHLLRPDVPSARPHAAPAAYLRTSVQQLRKGYLHKASSRVGAQRSSRTPANLLARQPHSGFLTQRENTRNFLDSSFAALSALSPHSGPSPCDRSVCAGHFCYIKPKGTAAPRNMSTCWKMCRYFRKARRTAANVAGPSTENTYFGKKGCRPKYAEVRDAGTQKASTKPA